VRRGFRHVLEVFQEAAAANREGDVFSPWARAYGDVRPDRSSLMFQMQAYAACETGRAQGRREEFAAIYKFVESVSSGDEEKVQEFFRVGMLINVAAAMDWARLTRRGHTIFLKGCLHEAALAAFFRLVVSDYL
jgi:hypothetical protein